MSDRQDREGLRDEILTQVRRYCGAGWRAAAFRPGVSRVPYAGRVFDAEEMVNLVDSALEFWLSHGRYSQRFEAELAGFLGLKPAVRELRLVGQPARVHGFDLGSARRAQSASR